MAKQVIYVGLDVDDTQYHGSALDRDTSEVITFQRRPTLAGVSQQLAKINRAFHDSSLNLRYEAPNIGYTPTRAAQDRNLLRSRQKLVDQRQ